MKQISMTNGEEKQGDSMNIVNTTNPNLNPGFLVEDVKLSSNRSNIIIEPLEKGYGHTLGNALRRVLLSSLFGAAPVQVRIAGIDHQFSTIDGVTEDILEITLNIKQMRIKAAGSGKGVLKLDVKGPKEVTAADFEAEAGFEIINKDLPIATVAKGKTLEMEVVVDTGVGYQLADEKQSTTLGDIQLDALFSPVLTVSYKIEATRVGRRTDYDKLVLDVQTDGSLTPVEAVKKAAQILARQFSQVYDPVVPMVEPKQEELSPEEAEVLRLTVEELDLPTRIANALRKGGFETVGDLRGASRQVIAKVKNLGEKSVDVIASAVEKKGVSLGQ